MVEKPEPIAVLVMAYGGPGNLEEVEPYLLDVRHGRPLSDKVLEEVKSRYKQIGGGSPILERTQDQVRALERLLEQVRPGKFKLFMGMRHWHPYISEAMEKIDVLGIERVIGIVMAPHFSRMSVGAYYERLEEATAIAQQIEVEKITSWNTDPGYLDTVEARVSEALQRFPDTQRSEVHIVFTAHSLPERILELDDPYPDELQTTYDLIKARFPEHETHFAYQSAAMTPEPWLGPDAGDLMLELIEQGVRNFLIAPIGFVSEHVEILYDIDIYFRKQVQAAGGRLERIEMPGADLRMMSSLAELIVSRAEAQGWA
jgi:ferrochelatase